MQVTVEETGGLERRMTVQVPSERVETEVDSRLKSLARTARIDGFRPGKVPFRVVQQRYEGRVRQEVVGELIESTYRDALAEQNLRPAGDPRIEPRNLQPGQDLEFVATFEIYPEVRLAPMEGLSVVRPVAEVSDADVDGMLEILRKQRVTWKTVDRPARDGDQVIVDYKATPEGGATPGYEEKNVPVELGASGFAELQPSLIGAGTGADITVEKTFPEDQANAALAGRTMRFDLHVVSVNEPDPPALDDEFARAFGVEHGGLDALRTEVSANMRRELDQAIRANVKDQVLEALLAANPVDVPAALVEDEIDRLMAQSREQAPEQVRAQNLNLPRELFQDRARRRVALGMLIAGLVKANGIQVDPARVRATVEAIAAAYEQPEEVVKWYYGNRELLSGIEALALEEQVVDWVLARATVTDQPTTFQALMKPGQVSRPEPA